MLLQVLLEKITDFHKYAEPDYDDDVEDGTAQGKVIKIKTSNNSTYYDKEIHGYEEGSGFAYGYQEAFNEILAYRILHYINKFGKAQGKMYGIVGELAPVPRDVHFEIRKNNDSDYYDDAYQKILISVQPSGFSKSDAFDEMDWNKVSKTVRRYTDSRMYFANRLLGNTDTHDGNFRKKSGKPLAYAFDFGLASFEYSHINMSVTNLKSTQKLVYIYYDLLKQNGNNIVDIVDDVKDEVLAAIKDFEKENPKYEKNLKGMATVLDVHAYKMQARLKRSVRQYLKDLRRLRRIIEDTGQFKSLPKEERIY